MIRSLIVAKAENQAIGRRGDLPWRLSADLKRFKSLTMGHHLIMGRKTFESIGRPLPGRTMVVVTRNPDWDSEAAETVASLEEAFTFCQGDTEAFVIGGAEIYQQMLGKVDRIYLTEVHANIKDADAFFPEIDSAEWFTRHSESVAKDAKNEFDTTFSILERRSTMQA